MSDAEVAKQLLDYFERSPAAMDTLEGIARWRMIDPGGGSGELQQIRDVLMSLVRNGSIETFLVNDTHYYRLAKRKR
jgi:hypothetical protein